MVATSWAAIRAWCLRYLLLAPLVIALLTFMLMSRCWSDDICTASEEEKKARRLADSEILSAHGDEDRQYKCLTEEETLTCQFFNVLIFVGAMTGNVMLWSFTRALCGRYMRAVRR